MSTEGSPNQALMVKSPISTPSPIAFLNRNLIKEGILSHLLTTITPLSHAEALLAQLPIDSNNNNNNDNEDINTTKKYNAKHPSYPAWGRTYGGIFVSQAMACGLLALPNPSLFYIHQIQSVFVRGGKEGDDIQYIVKALKTTKSFINQRVEAYQYGKLLFTAFLSFVTPNETNVLAHSFAPSPINFPNLPHPDTIPLFNEDLYNISRSPPICDDPVRQKMVLAQTLTMPITTKLIDREFANAKYWLQENIPRDPRQLMYVRFPNPSDYMFRPDDKVKAIFDDCNAGIVENNNDNNKSHDHNNQARDEKNEKKNNTVSLSQHFNLLGLAYASDYNMIPMLLRPHTTDTFPLNIQFSSLNHNITFLTNELEIFNDWLIFEVASPFLSNSRAQLTGSFYTRDGRCVAYVTQETLARVLDENIIEKFPNPLKVGHNLNKKVKNEPNTTNVTPNVDPIAVSSNMNVKTKGEAKL